MGALAGNGTEKQKSGERRKREGRRAENNRGERGEGEIKGTVKRKNSASSSYGGSLRGPLDTPITSANR